MYTILQISDFIIFRLLSEDENSISNLKLQKLLYYTQAWYMAFNNGQQLFDGKFQAWIHGPVNREIYDIFKNTKYLYSDISSDDIEDKDIASKIKEDDAILIDNVLETYAKFSGIELEILTHREQPWIVARKGFTANERCEVEIDENLMASYYRSRLK